MEKKITFIKKAISIHGNRYNYSLVEYKSTKTKVKLLCKDHGVFEQSPEKHIGRKQGCPSCSFNKKLTLNDFLIKAKEKHGDKYDYSLVDYKNSFNKVKILCPEHGEFKQEARVHLQGCGCPKCSGKNKTTTEVIESLKNVHGDKYDYSLVKYKSEKESIKIICPEHGVFEQTYNTHKKGHGCPKCVGRNKTTDEFILDAKSVHGNKYDYSLVEYKNSTTNINIICPEHGVFNQDPSDHLQGNRCVKCANVSFSEKKTKTTEEFIGEAKLVHGDKYNYSLVNYISARNNVKILCPEHGEFEQGADSHLRGHGCPKCGLIFDKSENEVKDFIKSLGINFIENSRNIISPLELDIYIPSHNMAIEYDGLYWHNEIN